MLQEKRAIRDTKRELTYKRIRRQILAGAFEPGQRVSATALAREFSVARSTVHESLTRLQAEGLIRKGGAYARTYVEEPNLDKVLEHYEVREYVEGLAARLAADHMNTRHVENLRELSQQASAADQAGDQDGFGEANLAFHHYLVAHCGNSLLLKIYEMHHLSPVWVHLNRSEDVLVKMPPNEVLTKRFERICNAISSRDGDEAEAAVRESVSTVIEQLRSAVKEKLKRRD